MENKIIALAIAIGSGLFTAFLFITVFHATSRKFRIFTIKVKCMFGFHKPSGKFVPAVGGRNVQRCLYCDVVTQEVAVTKNNVRRIR